MRIEAGTPVDLECLDETTEDLGAWAYGDEQEARTWARNDESAARAALRPLASGVHVTRTDSRQP